MQNKKSEFPLNKFEIVSLIVVIPIIFYEAMKLFVRPLNSPYMPYWVSTWLGFFAVLGLDAVLLVIIKLSPIKNVRIKIYLTLLILTLSFSILGSWVLLNALSDMMW